MAALASSDGSEEVNSALPDGVLVSLIVWGREVVMPRGPTTIELGDHVFVAPRTQLQPLIDRLFDPAGAASPE